MTDDTTATKGHRARMCEEFIGPMLDEMRTAYLARIADIATTELDPKARTDKLTSLSIALRVVGNLEAGLSAAIAAGRIAEGNISRAREVEKLSRDGRRLLDIVGAR